MWIPPAHAIVTFLNQNGILMRATMSPLRVWASHRWYFCSRRTWTQMHRGVSHLALLNVWKLVSVPDNLFVICPNWNLICDFVRGPMSFLSQKSNEYFTMHGFIHFTLLGLIIFNKIKNRNYEAWSCIFFPFSCFFISWILIFSAFF